MATGEKRARSTKSLFAQTWYWLFVSALHLAFAVFGWASGATEAIRDDFSAAHADAISRVAAQLGAEPYREESWPPLEEDLASLDGTAEAAEVQLIRLSAVLLAPSVDWERARELCLEVGAVRCSEESLHEMQRLIQ